MESPLLTSFEIGSESNAPTPELTGGFSTKAELELDAPVVAEGLEVTIETTDPTTVMVPESITVAGGSRTARFTIAANPVLEETDVTISAAIGRGSRKTAKLKVLPPRLVAVSLTPSTVTGGRPVYGHGVSPRCSPYRRTGGWAQQRRSHPG